MKKFILVLFLTLSAVTYAKEGLAEDNLVTENNKAGFFAGFGNWNDNYNKWRFLVSLPAVVRFSSKPKYLPEENADTGEQLATVAFNRLVSLESKDIPVFGLRADAYRIFSNNLFLNIGAESFVLKKANVPMKLLIRKNLEYIQPYSMYLNVGHVFPQTATSSFNLYFGLGYNVLTYKVAKGESNRSADKDFLYQIGFSYMLKKFALDLRYALIQDDIHIYEEVLGAQRKVNLSFKLITLNLGVYF